LQFFVANLMEPKYEEQFTAFVDFLGFSEAASKTDEATRSKVLDLLLSLSTLRREFDLQSTAQEGGKKISLKPAISTFSDHVVISYPLQPIYADTGPDGHIGAIFIMRQFNDLLTRIAAAALRIGFLVRGGATIGKLYHAQGVVFGEALIDAFQIESRTSVYPRVVLSRQITSRSMWIQNAFGILKDHDGLYHFDYFKELLFHAALPGESWVAAVKLWFDDVIAVINGNLTELESSGRMNEFAKWAWFARQFRSALGTLNPQLLKDVGVSLDMIAWDR
jgi:hypothetical protein